MVKVWGLQKAETNLELVINSVGEYRLSPKDAIMANGNGHRWRFNYNEVGENIPVEHIPCTLYLFINDVCYKNAKPLADHSSEEEEEDAQFLKNAG